MSERVFFPNSIWRNINNCREETSNPINQRRVKCEKSGQGRTGGWLCVLSSAGHMDGVIQVQEWPHRAGCEVWESCRTETDGAGFFGERMLSTVPTPYKAHWFSSPALSEELRNISFQCPPHGHDTWTRVRAVRSPAEARWAQGGEWTRQAVDSSPCPLNPSYHKWVCTCVSSVRCIVCHISVFIVSFL